MGSVLEKWRKSTGRMEWTEWSVIEGEGLQDNNETSWFTVATPNESSWKGKKIDVCS